MLSIFHEIFLLERIFKGIFFPCEIVARCLAEKCIKQSQLGFKSLFGERVLVKDPLVETA